MKKKWKWLKITSIVILVIALLLGVTGVWLVRRSWPDYSGKLKVEGLKDTVTIKRDKYGIPNIYAENEDDLFFAQGYVHAQDRLWQMEVSRRLCKGTMSEMAGEATLGLDKTVRLFGIYRIAEKSLPMLDNGTKAVLEAYCRGVNAYINTHRGKLPLEFTVMGVEPDLWTPVDVISWGNFMAFNTGQNYRYEVFRGNLTVKLGEEMAELALPPTEENHPVTIPGGVKDFSWLDGTESLQAVEIERFIPGGLTLGWASGAWAVQGKYTESGKAMLTSDAHMGLSIPSMWCQNGLHGGRFDVVGFSMPGVPMVVLGHNSKISWAFTNMNPDVQDLYIEKLDNTQNPTRYKYKEEWVDLQKIQETIKVKGKQPVEFEILSTNHGPLLKDLFEVTEQDRKDVENYKPEIGYDTPLRRERWTGTDTLSLRWPLYEGSTAMRSIYELNLSGNWEDFRNALQYWDTLSQNFVYADVEGNIGFQSAGKVPIRNAEHVGIVPVPGWDGEYEWEGYIPFRELPYIYNPDSGYVVSANNRMVPSDYKYNMSYDWFHPGYRATRINELLQQQISSGKKFVKEDMAEILGDTYNYSAKELVPYITTIEAEGENQTKALEYLKDWDYHHDVGSIGAAIYTVWFSYAAKNVYDDELSQKDIWGPHLPMKRILSMVKIVPDKSNSWFDNVYTTEVETRDDIIKTSFAQAVEWLEKEYGKDPARWQLGKVQTVRLMDMVFGEVPNLKNVFNSRKVYQMEGSPVSVSFAYSYTNPPGKYNVRYGSTQRLILEPGNWDGMLVVNSSGQNAQLFHPNREDQVDLWAKMQWYTLPYSEQGVDAVTKDVLVLEP